MNRRSFFGLLAVAPVAIAAAPVGPIGPQYIPHGLYFYNEAYRFVWPPIEPTAPERCYWLGADSVNIAHPNGKVERISVNVAPTR